MRLIDADALGAKIRELKAEIASRAAGWVDEDCYECGAVDGLHDALQYLDEAQAVNRWISADQYPDQAGQRYLLAVRHDISGNVRKIIGFTGYGDFAWYTDEADCMEDRYTGDNRLNSNYTVTHWMPLPEDPEGEAEA